MGEAGYQTIQAAINAANAVGGGIVGVQPGTYVENLTLHDGCHITGLIFADAGGGVNIQGVHTPPSSGGFVFNNVRLISATDIFNSSAAGTAHLVMGNAEIFVTNGYTFNLPNWTGKLESFDVNAAVGTNDGYVNNTGGSEVDLFDVSVGSGSLNPMIVSGVTLGAGANIYCPIHFITGCNAEIDYSFFGKPVTFSNNSVGIITTSHLSTGSSAAITMSSSGTWDVYTTVVDSTNNPVIDGAGGGTLNLSNVTFPNNSSISGSLTVVNQGLNDLGSIRSNFTAHSILLGQGIRGTITNLAPSATAGQVLQSAGSSADPVFSTATYPSTTTINQILYSSSANVVGEITAAIDGVLISNHTGVPSWLANSGTPGFVLTANSGAPPSWQSAAAAGSVTQFAPDSGTNPVVPTGAGLVTMAGSGSVTTVGGTNTITYQLTGLTNHALLVGAGTTTITKLGPTATVGQILQSAGSSADPAFSTATYPATTTINQILYSSSNNVVAGLSSANRGVLTTGATGIPVITALATDGQLIIGSTAGAPAAATLSAGSGISIANASNSVTISSSGGGFTWTDVSGATQAMSAQNGYIADRGTLVTFTLPTNNSLGDTIQLVGKGAGGWSITYTTNQNIKFGSSTTTTTTGSLSSTNANDCVTLVCTTASASAPIFTVTSSIGNLTVV